MKKTLDNLLFVLGLVLIAILLLFVSAYAGQNFNFGSTTYESADDILIVNSLGDQTNLSTFNKLGTNDFIPENAVKNYLALEGYTIANDYNPSVTNPQFPEYGVKPEDDMTKLTFAGLLGDPRATQDVYVLTKEYDRLGALGQANSIDNLNIGLNNESNNRVNGDNLLSNSITTETNNRISGDTILQNGINVVKTDLNNETTNRINSDNNLQTNINNEVNTRAGADSQLQNNINATNSKIDGVSKRVSALERTQYVIKTEVKFLREKNLEVGIYGEYNVGRSVCSEVGINIVVPIGQSYLDRENKKINAKLDRLEQKLGQSVVIERTIEKGKVKSIHISEGLLTINGAY